MYVCMCMTDQNFQYPEKQKNFNLDIVEDIVRSIFLITQGRLVERKEKKKKDFKEKNRKILV